MAGKKNRVINKVKYRGEIRAMSRWLTPQVKREASPDGQQSENKRRQETIKILETNKRKRESKGGNKNSKKQSLEKDSENFYRLVEASNGNFNKIADQKSFKKGQFKIITVNVNSLIDYERRTNIRKILLQNPEVLIMVDTRIKHFDWRHVINKTNYRVYSTNSNPRGIAILVKKGIPSEEVYADDSGNLLIITVELGGEYIMIGGIYGPNEDDHRFYEVKLDKALNDAAQGEVDSIILGGDFNIPSGNTIGYVDKVYKKKDALELLKKKYHLIDPAERPGSPNTTWPYSFRKKNNDEVTSRTWETFKAARLDYFLTDVENPRIAVKYNKFEPADHAQVELTVELKNKKPKNQWKMNANMFEDDIQFEYLASKIKTMAANLNNVTAQLTRANMGRRRKTTIINNVAFQKWKAIIDMLKRKEIVWGQKKASKYKNMCNEMKGGEANEEEYQRAWEEIKINEAHKNNIQNGLKNFKLNLENKALRKFKAISYKRSRGINKLVLNGVTVTDGDIIKKELHQYYDQQFRCSCDYNKNEKRCMRCRNDDIRYIKYQHPEKFSSKKLSIKQKKIMNRDIDIKELDDYVEKNFNKKNKSPSPDCVPYEFFHQLWPHLRSIMFTLIGTCWELDHLPDEISKGNIILLPKPNKDSKIIKNNRPLTMLNSIYKLMSGIVAERIKKVIPSIIEKNQFGFMKSKQAADMIKILKQIMEDKSDENKNVTLLALDFSAAFDSIHHEAIIKALRRKNFGENVVKFIAALLRANESTLIINCDSNCGLPPIKIRKGCRQGDPLSVYLFLLVIDELLEDFRVDPNIKGARSAKELVKAMAFADDNYTVFSGTTSEISSQCEHVLKKMKTFQAATGLKINVHKSEILTNSAELAEKKSLNNIQIVNKLKVLGVHIASDQYLKKIVEEKIDDSIQFWSKFKLGLYDKIKLVGSFILPKVSHIIKHLPFDERLANNVDQRLLDFVRGGKKKMINKNILLTKVDD